MEAQVLWQPILGDIRDRLLPTTRLALKKILKIAFDWANGASGKPALQL